MPALCNILKVHKSNISRTANKAIKMGFLEKIGKKPAVLNLTGKGNLFLLRAEKNIKVAFSSLGVRNNATLSDSKIRLHRLSIKFNLLSDANENIKWDKITNVKNWSKKFKFIDVRGFKFTIEKTPKSVILYLDAVLDRNLDFFSQLMEFILRHVRFADYWLSRRGIRFDDQSGEVLHQHLAHNEPSNEKVDKKSTVEVGLGRKAESVFKTKMSAKAWLDWSKSRDKSILDIESNDLTYNEKLILVPEKVHAIAENQGFVIDMAQNLKAYNENIKLHMKVMHDIRKGIRDLTKTVGGLK